MSTISTWPLAPQRMRSLEVRARRGREAVETRVVRKRVRVRGASMVMVGGREVWKN